MSEHWLSSWLDEFSIKSSDRAVKLVRDKPARDRLVELLELAKIEPSPTPLPSSGQSIVAGRALDLSGLFTCRQAECLIAKVDTVFSEVWHYFDSVTVEGPRAELLDTADPTFEWNLEQFVKVFLYLRKIGGMEVLEFRRKPDAFCEHHFAEGAKSAGMESLLDDAFAEATIKEILRTAQLTAQSDGTYVFTYAGSDVSTLIFPASPSAPPPDLDRLARMEYSNTAAGLVGDVALATYMKVPLIQSAEVRKRIRLTPTASLSAADVALELRLPVIRNVPVKELLALRGDHWPELIRFRVALRLAIETELKRMSDDPDVSAASVAREVVRRHLEPELAAIDIKLKNAGQVLSKKSAARVLVGTAVATVGLLAGAPLILGAGVTALASTLLNADKYIEERGSIQLSDMQFLWQARAKGH